MSKKVVRIGGGKEKDPYACSIQITCSHPTSDGNMEVEMNFEGDEALAAFLLENARQIFDGEKFQNLSR